MTDLVRNEELRFVDEQGLVRIVTRWPGGRTSLGLTGLSGRLHNHVMLVPDDRDPFLDGPMSFWPFVCEPDGTVVDVAWRDRDCRLDVRHHHRESDPRSVIHDHFATTEEAADALERAFPGTIRLITTPQHEGHVPEEEAA